MKQIDIEAQNIFEEKAYKILNELEEEIQNLIDTEIKRAFQQEAILEAIRRLYYLYGLIQTEFW